MIHKPPPFKGLNIRIPIIIPIKGKGLINHGSTLGFRVWGLGFREWLKLSGAQGGGLNPKPGRLGEGNL